MAHWGFLCEGSFDINAYMAFRIKYDTNNNKKWRFRKGTGVESIGFEIVGTGASVGNIGHENYSSMPYNKKLK
jgi:hypothetical protein